VSDYTIIYILLIIEHDGDVLPENYKLFCTSLNFNFVTRYNFLQFFVRFVVITSDPRRPTLRNSNL